MDGKRHPSSFQQLEKLGEGTYATVSQPMMDAANELHGSYRRENRMLMRGFAL